MITLIKNVKAYREGAWQESEILLADAKIEAVADSILCVYDDMTVIDGKGMYAVPGFIDSHVHITGGGGEGSFITQVPPMKFTAPVRAGVTTLLGLLGTDGTTRSVANLVAKTKAFNEFGLTAYCLTGNYNYPSITLTGSVMNDITFVSEIIGVKLAISDHRSPNISKEGLIKLASDARVAGLLSGKAGIVHMHTGMGKGKYDMLFEILEETDIPVSVFRPTHVGYFYDDAIRFAKLGGFIDFTCSENKLNEMADKIARALKDAPEGHVTFSTDSNGSVPIWNENKEMVGIGAARISTLPQMVGILVNRCGCALEEAIKPVTENAAKSLHLYPRKGVLAPGSDADIVLLNEALEPDTVFALGKCMMQDKQVLVREPFGEA